MRLLIVEANGEANLAHDERIGLPNCWMSYSEALRLHAPDADIHVAFPLAPGRQRQLPEIDSFDGIVLTGSAEPHGAESPQARPYLLFIEPLLASGKPVLGSCWGIQTVTILLGGDSGPNTAGTEIGLSRNIRLTEAGREHLLFDGMPARFSSPGWHKEHVLRLPEKAILLAENDYSPVQAYAYRAHGVDYMGFQFHPENTLEEFRAHFEQRVPVTPRYPEIIDLPEIAPPEVADPMMRTRPIGNWVNHVRAQTG